MTYTIEDFARDHGTDRAMVDREKERMLEAMRVYELREARKDRGLTQKEVASRMGVSQKRVSVLESGDLGTFKVDTLRRYAEGLGGSLEVVIRLADGRRVEAI